MKTIRDILKDFNAEDVIKFIFVEDVKLYDEGLISDCPVYVVASFKNDIVVIKENKFDGKRAAFTLGHSTVDNHIVIIN